MRGWVGIVPSGAGGVAVRFWNRTVGTVHKEAVASEKTRSVEQPSWNRILYKNDMSRFVKTGGLNGVGGVCGSLVSPLVYACVGLPVLTVADVVERADNARWRGRRVKPSVVACHFLVGDIALVE